MGFWDWKTGYKYQSLDTTAQPGSLDAEAGVMSSIFDRTGLRLICGEADKTSKLLQSSKCCLWLISLSQSMEAR
jgi:pleiotropic regulator 1